MGKCEQTATTDTNSGGRAIELFCLLWSKDNDNPGTIDTLAFATLSPWPAIPIPKVASCVRTIMMIVCVCLCIGLSCSLTSSALEFLCS
jgi:hypothetical protein